MRCSERWALPQPEIWRQLESDLLCHLTISALSPDAKKRLAEMCLFVWVWTIRGAAPYNFESEQFRLTLELANDSVRGAVAWRYAQAIGSFDDTAIVPEKNSTQGTWNELGKRIFKEVWPLEPGLQSAMSASNFAKVPARVELHNFSVP